MSADDDDPAGAWAAGSRPAPGLHVLATPIGAARDITLRALDILAGADLLLAEDTRSLRRLMGIHGIALAGRPLWSYHDHNGAEMRPRVLERLAAGQAVALASEAGTPLVADPGYALVREALAAGHPVHAAPGASAVLAALTVAGLPTDRFAFHGFAPTAQAERLAFCREVLALPMTGVIYESPRRIHRLLGALCEAGGEGRWAALCRELTKRFEEVRRGPVGALRAALAGQTVRGELVLVLAGAPAGGGPVDPSLLEAALRAALATGSLRAAADSVAGRFGLPRRDVYQMALALRAAEESGE